MNTHNILYIYVISMETLATMDEQTMANYFTRKLSQPIYIKTQSFSGIIILLFLRITFKFYFI